MLKFIYDIGSWYGKKFYSVAPWTSDISVFSKPWLDGNPRMAMALDVSMGILLGPSGLNAPEDISNDYESRIWASDLDVTVINAARLG